jgi:hypothetical protein
MNGQELGEAIQENWLDIVKKHKILKSSNIPKARVSRKAIIDAIQPKINLGEKAIKKLFGSIPETHLIKSNGVYMLGQTSIIAVIVQIKKIDPNFDDKAYLERIRKVNETTSKKKTLKTQIIDFNKFIVNNFTSTIKNYSLGDLQKVILNLSKIILNYFEKKSPNKASIDYLDEIMMDNDIEKTAEKLMTIKGDPSKLKAIINQMTTQK